MLLFFSKIFQVYWLDADRVSYLLIVSSAGINFTSSIAFTYFTVCVQNLSQMVQKMKAETEHLNTLLAEREIEIGACKKEIEMQDKERAHLESRNFEVRKLKSEKTTFRAFALTISVLLFCSYLQRLKILMFRSMNA